MPFNRNVRQQIKEEQGYNPIVNPCDEGKPTHCMMWDQHREDRGNHSQDSADGLDVGASVHCQSHLEQAAIALEHGNRAEAHYQFGSAQGIYNELDMEQRWEVIDQLAKVGEEIEATKKR